MYSRIFSIAFIATCSLQADYIYQTSFESPATTTGPIWFQDGWFPGGGDLSGAKVVTTNALSGTQSLELSSSVLVTRSVLLVPDQKVVSVRFASLVPLDATGAWFVGLNSPADGVAGFQFESNGSVGVFNRSGFESMPLFLLSQPDWNRVQLNFDLVSQRLSLLYNDVAILNDFPTYASNVDSFVIYAQVLGGTAYFDDVAISASVPEPASLLPLTLICLGGLLGLKRRSVRGKILIMDTLGTADVCCGPSLISSENDAVETA